MSDIFDFGFTAVDEGELESVRLLQQQTETVQQELKTVDNRAKALV